MIRLVLALLALFWPAVAGAERIVAGLSQNRVAITANFDGSEIIVYGAVRREAPAPEAPLDIIVTVEGPATPVIVRRKSRVAGIWINTEAVEIDLAPSFYAIAATGSPGEILSETENLRHRITIPRAIRAVGVAHAATDAPTFTDALIRLRRADGSYKQDDEGILLAEDTLFRTDVELPANLTEGRFRVRIFLVRDGAVIDSHETAVDVQKEGLERALHAMAMRQPLAYGILSLVLAVLAGWAASAAFRFLRP